MMHMPHAFIAMQARALWQAGMEDAEVQGVVEGVVVKAGEEVVAVGVAVELQRCRRLIACGSLRSDSEECSCWPQL
jgi:hypothetical protein